MRKEYDEITIMHPETGEMNSYSTVKQAKKAAKGMNYSPVFINLYNEIELVDEIKVTN